MCVCVCVCMWCVCVCVCVHNHDLWSMCPVGVFNSRSHKRRSLVEPSFSLRHPPKPQPVHMNCHTVQRPQWKRWTEVLQVCVARTYQFLHAFLLPLSGPQLPGGRRQGDSLQTQFSLSLESLTDYMYSTCIDYMYRLHVHV